MRITLIAATLYLVGLAASFTLIYREHAQEKWQRLRCESLSGVPVRAHGGFVCFRADTIPLNGRGPYP